VETYEGWYTPGKCPGAIVVYMNSLPAQLTNGLLLQYADDTNIICTGATPAAVQNTMCSQLSLIQQWILQSKMNINFKKSSVMWFKASNRSTRITCPPISVGGVVLQVTEKQKYLGLIFDSNMSWTHYVANVCGKMSYYLCLLRSHQHVIDIGLMKMLLESLVLSHLFYCVTVWGPSLGSTLLQRLQRMQNRAVRLCYNLRKYDHVSQFYHRLQWLPLPHFIQFKSLCSMYHQYHQVKCISLEPPISLVELLLIIQGHLHILQTYLCSACALLNVSFVIQWWNALPSSETDCITSPFYEYVDVLKQYCDSLL